MYRETPKLPCDAFIDRLAAARYRQRQSRKWAGRRRKFAPNGGVCGGVGRAFDGSVLRPGNWIEVTNGQKMMSTREGYGFLRFLEKG